MLALALGIYAQFLIPGVGQINLFESVDLRFTSSINVLLFRFVFFSILGFVVFFVAKNFFKMKLPNLNKTMPAAYLIVGLFIFAITDIFLKLDFFPREFESTVGGYLLGSFSIFILRIFLLGKDKKLFRR
jgi:hypothetical protein